MKKMLSGLAVLMVTGFGIAQSPLLSSWTAPAGFRSSHRGITTQSAAPFIAITPCRQYDSRITGGPLADNTPRTVALGGAPCNLVTSGIVAVSLNITVFSITGATGNGVFKVGDVSPPTTAWINYPPTETQRANAGAMSVDNSTEIFVQVNQGGGSVQFAVDVNGYYPNDVTGTTGQDTFLFKSANNGAGGFGTMRVENTATTGANAHAITARINSNSDGASAVFGHALATDGAVYGIKGATETVASFSDSAGVYGFDASGNPGTVSASSGVLGKSKTNIGVRGISRNFAVEGDLFDGSGNSATYCVLGFSPADAVYGVGNLEISGTKSFVDPHPTDASKVIAYVALEGPESGTYFRGRSLILRGHATITVPESFRLVSDEEEITVQVTPIGTPVPIAVVAASLDTIELRADRDVEFYYFVNGVRRAFKDYKAIQKNRFFGQRRDDRMMTALSPEQKKRLIANGTYNPNGTLNGETARRLGWDKVWEAREHPEGE